MLHIGDKDINLAVQGAGVLYVGSRKMGPIINESGEPTPSGTVLHLYDRIDGKGTVACFHTDLSGIRSAFIVLDSIYRIRSSNIYPRGTYPEMGYPSDDLNILLEEGRESATYWTDIFEYDIDTPQSIARQSTSLILDDKTYDAQLPNVYELNTIMQNRVILDSLDTSLSDDSISLENLYLGDGSGKTNRLWSSIPTTTSGGFSGLRLFNIAIRTGQEPYWVQAAVNTTVVSGIIPIIEIPVDENGKVITN